jgi:glycosyltransferase involved in cell wall biosynthesis
MLLIDGIYINNYGGRILLEYLIEEIEKTNTSVFYLLDSRMTDIESKIKKKNNILFLKASIFNRHFFYLKNKKKFNKIFCFGNLPPSVKTNSVVYTYFHQALYLNKKFILLPNLNFLFYFKKIYFKIFINNTNYWIFQTDYIKNIFKQSYPEFKLYKNLLTIPFYKELYYNKQIFKQKDIYTYVSSGEDYKNHLILFNAFEFFYKKNKRGILNVTVDKRYIKLTSKINELQSIGIPIINHNFLEQEMVFELYAKTNYIIYASLIESFGLGIIEAINFNCKIIGCDLPYMYAVCQPSLNFNPLNINDIVSKLELSLENNIKDSKRLAQNEIKKLLNILS